MGAGALAAGVFGGAVFLLAGRKFSRGSCQRGRFALWASLLFLGAFVFRVVLGYYSQGFTTDTDTFKSWANIANTVGFQQIYHEDIFLDYPPGYLYVLVFLEKLRLLLGLPLESQGYTLLIKLPSILADLFCAGVVLHLAKDKLGERAALFLAGAYLFCPAVYLNSAQWGQADSFCAALVLCSVLLLYRERYVSAALLFGVSIACKPQMLVFAPLYLFFAIKQRRWLKLLLGIALTVGAVLLLALPFTQGFNFLWLLERYQATLDYYNYYSVNAYNFWSLIGWNWQTLPAGLAGELLDFVGPVIATLCCGAAVFGSRRKEVVFYCPALLMAVMYAFSVKMHERYLFPALLFTLLAYLTAEDRGLLRSYAALATASYANVAYVLWQFREFYGSYDPNTPLTRFFSLGSWRPLARCCGWASGCTSGGRCAPARRPSPNLWWTAARWTAPSAPGTGRCWGPSPWCTPALPSGAWGIGRPPSPLGRPPRGRASPSLPTGRWTPSCTCRASPRTRPTTPPGWGSTSRWRQARMGSTGSAAATSPTAACSPGSSTPSPPRGAMCA